MNFKLKLIVFPLLVCLIVLLISESVQPSPVLPLKIGISLTLSGNTTRLSLGVSVRNGLKFWENWYANLSYADSLFNFSSGSATQSYRAELVVLDDAGDPARLVANYVQLRDDPSIAACFGPINSDFSLVARQILDGKKFLLQTAAAADATFVGSVSTYGILSPASLWMRPLLLNARLAGATSFGYVAEQQAFQQTLCGGTWSLGPETGIGRPLCNITVPNSLGEVTPEMLAAYRQAAQEVASGCAADVIILCAYYATTTTVVDEFRRIGFNPAQVIFAPLNRPYDDWGDKLYTIGANPWDYRVNYPADPFYGSPMQFADAFRGQFGYVPDLYDGMGAAAPIYLSDALRRAASLQLADLVFAMDRLDLSTFYGRLTYGTAHKALIDIVALQYQPNVSGTLAADSKTPVAPPTAQVDPIVYPAPRWDERAQDIGWFVYPGDVVMTVLASCAIALSLCFIAVILAVPRNPVVEAAQPLFLASLLFGSVLCYAAIYCWLYYVTDVSCAFLPWLMATGFSLMFGALFVKTFRLYRILRAADRFKAIIVPVWQLLLMLAVLLLLVWALLIPWTIVDPLRQHVVVVDPYRPSLNYAVCAMGDAGTGFLIAILVVEGILLLLAALIAFYARKVTFALFNESKYIGFAIYNLIIISAICLGLVAGLSDPVARFWVRTVCFLVGPLLVVLCLLLPKLYYMHRGFDKRTRRTSSGPTSKSFTEKSSHETADLQDPSDSMVSQLEALRSENESLKARLLAYERSIN